MITGYTLLNGFAIAFGFVLSLIALLLIIIGRPSSLLLIIALLILLLGLQGWQYISTLVHIEEVKGEIQELRTEIHKI